MSILNTAYKSIFLSLFIWVWTPSFIYSYNSPQDYKAVSQTSSGKSDKFNEKKIRKHKKIYYLYTEDFIKSFIEIPTSNVLIDSSTLSSKYLAGRAPVYNLDDEKVGICSASFLCMQNEEGIFTDISNYLSIDNGLIITWFTPTTLINLELDSIVHSMVTECIVIASTKVGFNPYYGEKFNMVVSGDQTKIFFKLHKK